MPPAQVAEGPTRHQPGARGGVAVVEHFYVGIDRPWMFELVAKPMVSVNSRMARRLDLRIKEKSWADSGAFHLIRSKGAYPHTHEEYEAWLRRMCPTYYTQMDWPCEPDVIASSGLTVAEHQARSADSIARCAEFEIPGSTLVPTIQGWRLADYLRAAQDLEDRGLWRPYMAIGSICRRGQVREIRAVIAALREFAPTTRFHGFGVKTDRRLLRELYSADSFAWRMRARKDLYEKHGSGFEQKVNLSPYLEAYERKARRWEAVGGHERRQTTLRTAFKSKA